jgi:hypothetical protein
MDTWWVTEAQGDDYLGRDGEVQEFILAASARGRNGVRWAGWGANDV